MAESKAAPEMPKWVAESRRRAENKSTRQADKQHFKKRLGQLKKTSSKSFKLSATAHVDHDVKRGYYVMLQQILDDSSHNAKPDIVLLHLSKLPELFRCLSSVKKAFQQYEKHVISRPVTKSPAEVIECQIPEEKGDAETDVTFTVDHLDLHSWQTRYRRELARLYAERMRPGLQDAVEKRCSGCLNQCGTQMHHDMCIVADFETRVEACFDDLIETVNEEEVNAALFDAMGKSELLPFDTSRAFFKREELLCDPEWTELVKRHILSATTDSNSNSA